jgi:hypothetical protein
MPGGALARFLQAHSGQQKAQTLAKGSQRVNRVCCDREHKKNSDPTSVTLAIIGGTCRIRTSEGFAVPPRKQTKPLARGKI